MISDRIEALAEGIVNRALVDADALHARREELQDLAVDLRGLGPRGAALANGLDAARLLCAGLLEMDPVDRREIERLVMQCVVFVSNGVERLEQRRNGSAPREEEEPPTQPFPALPDTQAMASAFLRRNGHESPLQLTTESHLGEILQRMGKIDQAGMDRALEVQRSRGLLLSEALVRAGACTEEDVREGMEAQREARKRRRGAAPEKE